MIRQTGTRAVTFLDGNTDGTRVIYQGYSVSSIPVDQYTHLLYSFANMSAEGTVYLSDPYADTQVS
jgi:GH18 family chitinase